MVLHDGEQAGAAVLGKIEHMLKCGHIAVIRVRNFDAPRCRCKTQKQTEVASKGAWPHRLERIQIRAIHCQYPVESREVRRADLPRPQGREIVPAPPCRGDGATIRRTADVPIAGSGRIDVNLCRKTGAHHGVMEHALHDGRSADIAKADE